MVVREFDPDDAKEIVACAEYIAKQYWLRSKRAPPGPRGSTRHAGSSVAVPPRCDPVSWSPVRTISPPSPPPPNTLTHTQPRTRLPSLNALFLFTMDDISAI